MTEKALYLEDDLSLNKLSNAINEKENHISETLSQHLHTNFFQFVNRFRIEAAKEQLKDRSKLIPSVAYDVGFNSKSTLIQLLKRR